MPHRPLPPLRGRDREAGITRHPNFYIRPSFRTSLLNIALYVRSSNQTRRCSTKPLKKLFARSLTQVFRPPGPDRRDSFFAGRCPPWTFRPGSAAPWQLTRRSSTVSAFLSNELIVMVAGGLPARPSSMNPRTRYWIAHWLDALTWPASLVLKGNPYAGANCRPRD
jgi:hypothetical protein